jgi:hypothetical protein
MTRKVYRIVYLEDTYSVYLSGHPLLYNSQFVSYLPLLVLLEDTYSVYLPGHPMYPPTRGARAGKIQIGCIITMDDQEGIQNMYPPTRRARVGKIQIDCIITMDDQEGIQNMIHILYTFLVIHCNNTVNLYLTRPYSSCWRIHILYTFLVIHCYSILQQDKQGQVRYKLTVL